MPALAVGSHVQTVPLVAIMRKILYRRSAAQLLIIGDIIASVLIYGRGIDNHFVSDDWFFLYEVSKAHALSDISKFLTFNTDWFVRPTQWITTWVLYQIAGLNPMPYHLASLTFEVINASLLGFFAYRLLKTYQQPRSNSFFVATVVATLFLFSWRHHEAVFWYSSVNELLAAFFRLSSLLLITFTVHTKNRAHIVLIGFAALGAFVLAIFSKESAIVFPLELGLLLGLDYLVRSHEKGRLALAILALAPFIILVGFWTYPYLQTSSGLAVTDVGRSGLVLLHSSPLDLVLRFLQFFHGNYIGTGFISRSIPLMMVEFVSLVFFGVIALIRRRYIWFFALFWTLIAIAPYVLTTSRDAVELQLPVLMLGVTGDRFLYYSSAGASLLFVATAQWMLDEFRSLANPAKWFSLYRGAIGLAFLVLLIANASRIIGLEADWDNAGKIGNSIIRQVSDQISNPSLGDILCVENLPDSFNNKYIFRNGISQALYLSYSRDDFAVRATVHLPHTFRDQPQLDETNCSYILSVSDLNTYSAELDHGENRVRVVRQRTQRSE